MNGKQIITTLLVLLSAALLEAGGDAVVRLGLRASTTFVRASLFLIGGLVLFTYGYVVNAPPWDFGRLLGVYVVFFFLVAQFISWLVFDRQPTGVVIVGRCFIVAGGNIPSPNPLFKLRFGRSAEHYCGVPPFVLF